jgi:ureidoacrylate peracid hydrolase
MSRPDDDLLIRLDQKAAPGHAALVVVDVQNDFVADQGFFGKIGADVKAIQQRCIPNLKRLVDGARGAGVPVVFIQAIYDPKDVSAPMRERNRRRTVEMPRCLTGSWGADFHGVRPLPGEKVVIKHRYSGMINTELDAVLKQLGVDSLLMTGVATDTCVESTARDAYFMDYYVTLVEDCCGAFNVQDHQNALKRFDRDYGAVVTADEVIAAWAGLKRPAARAAAAGDD